MNRTPRGVGQAQKRHREVRPRMRNAATRTCAENRLDWMWAAVGWRSTGSGIGTLMRVASKQPLPDWMRTAPRFTANGGFPAHVKIERWLTDVIGRGDLVPGDRLPREDELAALFGVSRMTLRQALATLESLGTVVRSTGRTGGTFVTEPRIECDLTGLAGFTEQLRRANLRAGARMVSAMTVAAPAKAAEALAMRRGAPVHAVVRVRTAQRKPVVLERSYFPVDLFPDLLEQRLTGSLYGLLRRRYQQKPHMATENLEPVIAREEEAELLDIDEGSPLMLIERTAFTSAGQAVEYARDLIRPDRVRVSLQTGLGPNRRPSTGRHIAPAT